MAKTSWASPTSRHVRAPWEYRDLLELPSLQDCTPRGQSRTFKPGTEIEYWLESADACDYPRPKSNVTRQQAALQDHDRRAGQG